MASWWHRDVIAAGKLPLMLCFLAFVLTFVLTRTITRLIRDGRGPFRNHVTAGGTHIHHAVPGIILLITGAFTAVGGPDSLGWRSFAAVAVGVGTSLVLDEFALILHLQDVYWSGRASWARGGEPDGRLPRSGPHRVQPVRRARRGRYRAVISPDRDRDPHRRWRARGDLRAEGKYRTALFGLSCHRSGRSGGCASRVRPRSGHGIATGASAWNARRDAPTTSTGRAPLQTGWADFVGGSCPGPTRGEPLMWSTSPVIAPWPCLTGGGRRLPAVVRGLAAGQAQGGGRRGQARPWPA